MKRLRDETYLDTLSGVTWLTIQVDHTWGRTLNDQLSSTLSMIVLIIGEASQHQISEDKGSFDTWEGADEGKVQESIS